MDVRACSPEVLRISTGQGILSPPRSPNTRGMSPIRSERGGGTTSALQASTSRPDTTKSVHFTKSSAVCSPSSAASHRSRQGTAASDQSKQLEDMAASVWWLDGQQLDEEAREWVKISERVRPSTAERKRIDFTLNRQRAAHLRRIVEYHRAGHEAVDEFGRSRLPAIDAGAPAGS